MGAGIFGVGGEGGHGHEAGKGEGAAVGEDMFDGFGEGVGGKAVFGGFAGDIDFEVEFGAVAALAGCGLEGIDEADAIDGVDGFEEADGLFGFVALEVADELPAGGGGAEGDFPGGFLDFVFSEEAHAGIEGIADGVGAVGFGDGDEGDFFGGAARAFGGSVDAIKEGIVDGDEIVHCSFMEKRGEFISRGGIRFWGR